MEPSALNGADVIFMTGGRKIGIDLYTSELRWRSGEKYQTHFKWRISLRKDKPWERLEEFHKVGASSEGFLEKALGEFGSAQIAFWYNTLLELALEHQPHLILGK